MMSFVPAYTFYFVLPLLHRLILYSLSPLAQVRHAGLEPVYRQAAWDAVSAGRDDALQLHVRRTQRDEHHSAALHLRPKHAGRWRVQLWPAQLPSSALAQRHDHRGDPKRHRRTLLRADGARRDRVYRHVHFALHGQLREWSCDDQVVGHCHYQWLERDEHVGHPHFRGPGHQRRPRIHHPACKLM